MGTRNPQPSEPKKIVYLFGAGATHAEIQNLYPRLIEENRGLLIRDVSRRVIERARSRKKYLRGLEMVSGTSGSLNIELLISLIENSKVSDWEAKSHLLKVLVQEDIESILTEGRARNLYLHKALFELHSRPETEAAEHLVGVISLNYEDVLDRAYKCYHGDPDYCLSPNRGPRPGTRIPLLKLHGSFTWKNVTIRGRKRTIEIIPLGSNKTYLHAPYRFIWNEALEMLMECDALRVIGCSLSQNDLHLIELLFQAHLERGAPFDIEVICQEREGTRVRGNYGFLPRIKTLIEIESHLIPDPDPENPFKEWLKYKGLRTLGKEIRKTRYLKRVAG